jgi:hypothetical protein
MRVLLTFSDVGVYWRLHFFVMLQQILAYLKPKNKVGMFPHMATGLGVSSRNSRRCRHRNKRRLNAIRAMPPIRP